MTCTFVCNKCSSLKLVWGLIFGESCTNPLDLVWPSFVHHRPMMVNIRLHYKINLVGLTLFIVNPHPFSCNHKVELDRVSLWRLMLHDRSQRPLELTVHTDFNVIVGELDILCSYWGPRPFSRNTFFFSHWCSLLWVTIYLLNID